MKIKGIFFIFLISAFFSACANDPQGDPDGNAFELHFPNISFYMTNPPDDPSMDDALIEMIGKQSSAYTMEVCLYGLDRENVLAAIEDAIAGGVHVRFVGNRDSGGDYYAGYTRIARALDDQFGGSRAADIGGDYPDFRLVNPGAIMHNKFIIVTAEDGGQYLFTGTTNVTESGFELNNNNSIIFHNNEIAGHYRTQFEFLLGVAEDPVQTAGSFVIDGIPVEVFFSPYDTDGVAAIQHICNLAGTADSSIHFLIFSFPYMPLNYLMLDKFNAGLDVKGVIDESQKMNCAEEFLAQQGVAVRIDGNYNSSGLHGGKLHHKTMIIDSGRNDAVVVTGSFNWSRNADENNDENFLFIHSKQVAEFYEDEFLRRWEEAAEVPVVENPGDDASAGDVVISEVMWMGSRANDGTAYSAQEFVELRNNTAAQIDLSAWIIHGAAMSGKPVILPEATFILPDQYLVIMDSYPDAGSYAYSPQYYRVHNQLSISNDRLELILEDPDRTEIDRAGDGGEGVDFAGISESGSDGSKMSMFRLYPWQDGSLYTSWSDSIIQLGIDPNFTDHTYGSPGADNTSGSVSYNERDVVISEVAWAGTDTSASDEWIELHNNTASDITFDGSWDLNTADSGLSVILTGKTIPANGYFLLERSDDNSVPQLAADLIYSNSLNNDGDQLILKYGTDIIDQTPEGAWTAGSNSVPKSTMERLNFNADGSLPGSWAGGPGDTEGAQNSGS